MSQFQYALPAGRINKLKGEILAHAVPVEVLGITGQQRTRIVRLRLLENVARRPLLDDRAVAVLRPDRDLLDRDDLAGVDESYRVGGAQAVAALAFMGR